MKKQILLVLTLVATAGCVDTPDSVCLEFRNANNEHIDALMMVTNERQAARMTVRVFSQMSDRYKALDKKWDIMETNWGGGGPDAQAAKDFLESDGLHLYRAEYRANAQRCSLEFARLRNLLDQLLENAKRQAREEGGNPEEINAAGKFPALNAIVNSRNTVNILKTQLENPRLEQLLTRFNNRIDVEKPEQDKVLKTYYAKQELFSGGKNRRDIQLVR